MIITELEPLSTKTAGANGTSLDISGFGANEEYQIFIDVNRWVGKVKFVLEDSVNAFTANEELAVRHLDNAGEQKRLVISHRDLRKAARFGTTSAVMRLRLDISGAGATVTYAAHVQRNA